MSGVRRIVARNPNPQPQSNDGAPEAGIQAVGDSNSRTDPEDLRPDPETIFPIIVGWYRSSRDHWQEFRQEMAECFDLKAGHQWTDEDLAVLSDQSRPAFTLNMIDKFLASVEGLEINNRQETTYLPRQVGASGVTDLLTSAAQWARQECDAEDEETEAFLDAATAGWGCCLSGDAEVRLPKTHMMTVRNHSGVVIDIDLENGKRLTGTPNHPVLTVTGWKRLCDLQEGDDLVNSRFLERVQGLALKQFDQVEARFEDKINSFRIGRVVSLFPTSRNDFHGDGAGSKVHVVYSDRLLKRKIKNAARFKRLQEKSFAWADSVARSLGLFGSGLFGRPVFVAEHDATFLGRETPYFHVTGDLFISERVACGVKAEANSLLVKIKGCADFLGRHLLLGVKAPKFLCRERRDRAPSPISKFDPGNVEAPLDSGYGYAKLVRDFRDWKPTLEVQVRNFFCGNTECSEFVTRVKKRIVRPVHDFPVYDAATSVGFFIAGDIITSNTQSRMDYDEEPDGMAKIERIDPLEMFPDANARKQNLTDARYVIRVKDVPVGPAEELFPEFDALALHAQWAEDQPDATRSPHNARLAPYYRIDQSADVDRNEQLIRLVEVEWWEYVTCWRVEDPMTGRYFRLDDKRAKLFAIRARTLGWKPRMVKDRMRKYWKAIVGSEVLKIMDGPKKGGFTYKFITGKRDVTKGTWYGIVRAMRDPQLWLNKWVSQGMHIFNTNAKGGLIIETDAVADIDETRDAWAEADSIIEVNPGGLNKIKAKDPAQFPQQLNQMTEMALASFPQVTGIPTEIFGQSTSAQPNMAMLEVGRRQAGMNVLAWIFNAKRRYHKEQGRLLLWMIQTYIADGRLIRIGGEGQQQYVPLVHVPGLTEYDVIVDDAPTSANMKDKVWNALMQMFPMIRGIPEIPPQFYINALKYSPAPASFVNETQQIMMQPRPPNPDAQAKIGLDQAKTAEMQGRAALHQAEVQHMGAETGRVQMVTQLAPVEANLKVLDQQSKIENTRAQAALALQKAGIASDDIKFQHVMAAVDALLRSHGAALDHVQGIHDRGMDVANLQQQQQQQQIDQQQAQQPQGASS